MTPVLKAANLGKMYKRYRHPSHRLLEWLTADRVVRHQARWVLRHLDIEAEAGECVGVIGQNGSGKSTLLKILAGVTQPSEGAYEIKGRTSALLELGLGFHPDFTGRQNARMAARLMGLSPAEIEASLPEVEAFAEIGDYFDQPVRTYSSGMHVRLAFSSATAVRPEVLIVDEALAVGDIYFQHKCFDRLRRFKKAGTTILFVSHDPGSVKSLCDRAVLLDRGETQAAGPAGEVLEHYNALIAKKEAGQAILKIENEQGRPTTRSGSQEIRIEEIQLLDGDTHPARAFLSGETAAIRVRIRARKALPFPTVGFLIRDVKGNDVFGTNTYHLGISGPDLAEGESAAIRFETQLQLGPGRYTVTAAVHTLDTHLECNYDWWDRVIGFEVVPAPGAQSVGVALLPVSGSLMLDHPPDRSLNAPPKNGGLF